MLPRSFSFSFFVSLLALSTLSACERSELDEKQKDQIQQWSGDSSFADEYFLDDLSCQGSEGAVTVGSSSVRFFQDGQGVDQSYDFSSFGSFDTLSGPGFSNTYYDFHQVSECTGDDLDSCGDAKVVSAPKKLKVCRANDTYPRLSVEGIALTSLANLSRAAEYYKTVPGASPGILPANLLVLPKIEYDFADGSKVMDTDNLAYTPSYGKQPAFIVHPKSKRAVKRGLWVDVNLWEVPWGLAHEYGHHVFRTHTGIKSVSDSSARIAKPASLPLGAFDHDGHSSGKGLGLQGNREVTAADHWSAVNEGYADLYAFYVYGARPGLTKNLDCFDKTREVSDDALATGVKKDLSQDVLATFLAPTFDESSGDCDEPSLQEVHTIGAIVAHGVDALFSAKVGASEGEEAALKKAEMLLLWANRMGVTAASSTSITIERLIRDAVATVADGSKLTKAECDAVRANFSAFAGLWLTGDFTCQ